MPPVDEPAPENDVGFPFDQRWGLKLWRAAFFHDPNTEPDERRNPAWNRGKALVNGAAHCAACHTSRNFAGGRELSARFAGNDQLPGGSKAPAIRPDDLAKNDWTVSNLAYALQTGLTPSGDAFGGSMAEVVREGTRFLTPVDREAMALFLLNKDSVETADAASN